MKFKKVKLPRIGRRHPLVVGLDRAMKEHGCSRRTLAIHHLKLAVQSVDAWYQAARYDRDWPVPPRNIINVCRLTGQPPYLYNPDLWPNPEWRV